MPAASMDCVETDIRPLERLMAHWVSAAPIQTASITGIKMISVSRNLFETGGKVTRLRVYTYWCHVLSQITLPKAIKIASVIFLVKVLSIMV
jgi:hypothetical protein